MRQCAPHSIPGDNVNNQSAMPQPGRMAGLGFVAQWNGYAKKPPLYGKPIVTERFLMWGGGAGLSPALPATKGWELTHVMLPPFGAWLRPTTSMPVS